MKRHCSNHSYQPSSNVGIDKDLSEDKNKKNKKTKIPSENLFQHTLMPALLYLNYAKKKPKTCSKIHERLKRVSERLKSSTRQERKRKEE
jgi:hypothetical protein